MKQFLTIALAAMLAAPAFAQKIDVTWKGDTATLKIENPTKYLILPVEEEKDEKQVLLDNGKPTDTWMDVRLAEKAVDYDVPFALSQTSLSARTFSRSPSTARRNT